MPWITIVNWQGVRERASSQLTPMRARGAFSPGGRDLGEAFISVAVARRRDMDILVMVL